jgi:hypothetical protein
MGIARFTCLLAAVVDIDLVPPRLASTCADADEFRELVQLTVFAVRTPA